MPYVTTVAQRGLQQGTIKVILRQLRHKFGAIEANLEQQLQKLSAERLEDLTEALLDFKAKSELSDWLQTEWLRQGTLNIIVRQIKHKFGTVEAALERDLQLLSITRLQDLAVALLDFKTESELTDWLYQEGLHLGTLNVILILIKHKFGAVEAGVEQQLQGLSVARLQDLAVALLDFKTESELTDWLHQE
jgi:hypothetical protein